MHKVQRDFSLHVTEIAFLLARCFATRWAPVMALTLRGLPGRLPNISEVKWSSLVFTMKIPHS